MTGGWPARASRRTPAGRRSRLRDAGRGDGGAFGPLSAATRWPPADESSPGGYRTGRRTFADRLADRQSVTIPSEDADYGDLGQAFPSWATLGHPGPRSCSRQCSRSRVPADPAARDGPRCRLGGCGLTTAGLSGAGAHHGVGVLVGRQVVLAAVLHLASMAVARRGCHRCSVEVSPATALSIAWSSGRGGLWVDFEVFATGLDRYESRFAEALDLLLAALPGGPAGRSAGESHPMAAPAVERRRVVTSWCRSTSLP